ncbi:hypothetical protein [Schlesneria sp.]|uniref:hypothetical protein n=1 Tax=Schlesneria sp. TaxID=2762018 RepID=UPI002F1F0FC2
MPLKLNVGLSKKIGLPDYGSIGASVHLELELDSGAVGDPDRLRHQIRHLFGMAKSSVEAELINQQSVSQNGSGRGGEPRFNGDADGHATNGNHSPHHLNRRTATQSQIRAIRAIANRERLDLGQQLEKLGVRAVEDLGIQQASQLIDELKAQPAGTGGTR